MADAIFNRIEERAAEAGLPKRLSVRLAALARAGLGISEVLLELLAEGDESKPLRNLMLTPGLVELASSLNQERLLALVAAIPSGTYFEANPLQLIEANGLRCIALAEEEPELSGDLPDQTPNAEETTSQASGRELAAMDAKGPAIPALSRADASHVFGADQLAAIKLTLATSTSSDAKVEAVRKLWLSPISAEEKVVIFLLALRDSDRKVRAEAARGLGTLGLDGRVAENLARACSAIEAERIVAVSNLAHMLQRAADREVTLAIAVLAGLLDSSEPLNLSAQAISLLKDVLPPKASASPDLVRDVHHRLQNLLLVLRIETLQPARRLYEGLLNAAPQSVAKLMRESLDEVSPRHLRSFYLSLIATSGTSIAREPDTVSMLVQAMLDGDELDPSHYALGQGIRLLGPEVLPTLLQDFRGMTERKRIRLIGTFSDLFQNAGLEESQASAVVSEVLDAFSTGGPDLRRAVYESPLLRSPALKPDVRARAAKLLLADIHMHELEVQRDVVSGAVVNLGGPAWSSVLDVVLTGTRQVTVETACDILGMLVDRHPESDEVVDGVQGALPDLLAALEQPHYPARGALYRAVARVAGHRNVSRAEAVALVDLMLERAGTTSSVYDIVEGLGWLAAADSIGEDRRMELCHTLLGFLQLDLPKLSGRTRMVAEEQVIEFGRETTAYTDLIPRLLEAMGRVLERPRVSTALWNRIVEVLRSLFSRAATYEIVWAPAATLTLAQILGRAAASPNADSRLREDLTELLLLKAGVTPIVQVLGQMCMTELTPRMDLLAGEVFDRLIGNLESEETPEPAERRELLRSLAGLLRRDRIGDDAELDRRIRRRILDHLAAGLRDKLPGVGEIVKLVVDQGQLNESDRDELAAWLEKSSRSKAGNRR